MIVLIDNYDSFTHNLYQYLRELTDEPVAVIRNDRATVDDIEHMQPSHIVISPGPGRPEDAGISVDLVRRCAPAVPILGVCLGHQVIAQAFGARIVAATRIVHGKAEPVRLDGRGLFRSIASPAVFTRYHSLAVDPESVSEDLEVTARSEDGEIMGIRHRTYIVEGVQFHPESVASEAGKKLLANFLHYRREPFVTSEVLSSLVAGDTLSRREAANFMEELTEGNLSEAQIAGFLVAMAVRGPTPEEIAGCAEVLQRKRIPIQIETPVLDTCGTGGDGLGTFNISSMSALVAASCGVTVAKHGNRAVSSRSGSADFYRELGLAVDLRPEQAAELIRTTGFGFLYAPIYHGAMRHAAVPRRELGIKTIMNLLGPLVNPAGAAYQLIGVYSPDYARTVAQAAHLLGITRVMVVHGEDGLDELSVAACSLVVGVNEHGEVEEYTLDPATFGITGHALTDLAGGDATENAAVAWELLDGRGPAAVRDAVILNAAAALLVANAVGDLRSGVAQTKAALSDGSAKRYVADVISASRRLTDGGAIGDTRDTHTGGTG